VQPQLRTIADVARDIVREVAPEQLAEFDFVAQRYASAPEVARRSRRPSNEPTASILDFGGEALTAVAIGPTTDIAKDLIKLGVRQARRRGSSWLRKVLSQDEIDLDEPVPALASEQVDLVHAKVVAAVLAGGGSAELASSVSAALVRSWPRSGD
jgi:hypothetical protein